MRLLEKYLFKTFSTTFFPIFLTLYIITSIIFLVKIAALTSIIQMNFLELIEFYSYSIPTILFYTIPISYFIGITITIGKLSLEYETIIITSFGLSPTKLIKMLFPYSLIISFILLIISLGLIPKANYLKQAFLNIKKQEAQFNIKPSEYGQQIGNWLIYVNKENNNTFYDITLLQLSKKQDQFISADMANIGNINNSLSINLQNGKSFNIADSIQQVDFQTMILNHSIAQAKNIKSLRDMIMYWDDRKQSLKKSQRFTFNILISLFPLVSLFFILSIGYFNPRYNTNKASTFSSLLVIIFVVIANELAKLYPNSSLLILPLVWFIFGYLSYWFVTKRLY